MWTRLSFEDALLLWKTRVGTEPFLEAMRTRGASPMETIIVLTSLGRMTSAEAKRVLDDSRSWHDLRLEIADPLG